MPKLDPSHPKLHAPQLPHTDRRVFFAIEYLSASAAHSPAMTSSSNRRAMSEFTVSTRSCDQSPNFRINHIFTTWVSSA